MIFFHYPWCIYNMYVYKVGVVTIIISKGGDGFKIKLYIFIIGSLKNQLIFTLIIKTVFILY